MRSIVISISDGLLPSRNGLGGFLKFLILKCLNISKIDFKSEQEAEFLCTIVPVIVESLTPAYPALGTKTKYIQDVIRHTDLMQKQKVVTAVEITDRYLTKLKNPTKLTGEQIWRLFKGDGSGDEISIEFIRGYCGDKKKIQLDLDQFDRLLLEENEKALKNMKNLRTDYTVFIEFAGQLNKFAKTDDSFKYNFDMEKSRNTGSRFSCFN